MKDNLLMFENAVLGAIVARPKHVDTVMNVLEVDDLLSPLNQKIYTTMLGINENGGEIDELSILDNYPEKHPGLCEHLMGLADSTPVVDNVLYYCEIVKDKAVKRVLSAKMKLVMQELEEKPAEATLEACYDLLETMNKNSAKNGTTNLTDAIAGVLDGIEDKLNGKVNATIRTGFRDLDQLLAGGLLYGRLDLLGGSPGSGKTAYAINLLVNIAYQGVKVHMVSVEMPEKELAERIMCIQTGIEYYKLQDPDLLEDSDDLSKIDNAYSKNITIDDSSYNTHQVKASIRRAAREGAKFFVVDYLQLIDIPPGDTRHLSLGRFTYDLSNLAKSLGVNILAISSLNSNLKEGIPTMNSLSESGNIKYAANRVFLIHDPCPTESGEGSDTRKLKVGKNRQGTCGEITLSFDGPKFRFSSATTKDKFKAKVGSSY